MKKIIGLSLVSSLSVMGSFAFAFVAKVETTLNATAKTIVSVEPCAGAAVEGLVDSLKDIASAQQKKYPDKQVSFSLEVTNIEKEVIGGQVYKVSTTINELPSVDYVLVETFEFKNPDPSQSFCVPKDVLEIHTKTP